MNKILTYKNIKYDDLDIECYIPKIFKFNLYKEIKQYKYINKLINDKILTYDDLLKNIHNINYDIGYIPYKIDNKTEIQKQLDNIIYKIQNIKYKDINLKISKSKNNYYIKYKKILYKISIEKVQYYKSQILKEYEINNKLFYEILFSLYLRYNAFGLYNGLMASVQKYHYNKLINTGLMMEGFGGFFNHTCKYFCSIFVDLEYIFGSCGDFFKLKINSGKIALNPPFNVKFMNNLFNYVINTQNINLNKTSILFIIPVWDINHRKTLNKICKNKLKTDYKNDIILYIHKYTNKNYLYCKENFLYEDFLINKKINYAATNIFMIDKNNLWDINIKKIFGNYDFILSQ